MNKDTKVSDHELLTPLSPEDYKTFFEALGKEVIASATDAKGNIIYVNDKFVEVSKYSREELLGQNHRILKSGYHPPEFYKNLWNTISSGHVWRGEIKNKAKDGTFYWVDTSIAPVLGADGTPAKYVSVRFLITEKKTTQEIANLASIVQSSDDGFVGMGLDGIISSWNPGAVKMFGYTANEIIGKSGTIIYPSERASELSKNIEKIKKEESVAIYETKRKRKDGTLLDVSVKASAIRDGNGKIVGIAVIDRDITILKQASQYARSLIEASLDPLVTISAEGKITDVNEATIQVTGVTKEKLIGSDFSIYFTEPDKAREGYQRVFSQGNVTDYPLTIRHQSGKTVDVLYNASVYKDERGKVLGVFAAARDITAQKQASQYARSLIEASLDPLVTISVDGKVTDVNEATAKIAGVGRQELIGTDFSNYFTEPEKAREGYEQVFKKGFVTDYPLTIRSTDGKLTDVLYNASVYKDTKGNVLGVFAAARDVTVTKQASQYARSLIEASLDPLVTISPDGKITDVNEATVQVTGVSREKLIGSDFSNYFTEPEEARLGYLQVFKEGLVRDYPLAIRHVSGTVTDVFYNATVYKDSLGKVQGVFAAARDITERKKAEDQLHATSAYARSLIESSLDPLVTISPEGKITDVNHATEQITGVSREWLIGTDFSNYFTEPRKAREGYRQVLKEASVRDYPLQLRHASGRVLDVLYNAAVYRDAQGKVRGVFAAARDVTSTKQASQYARSLIEASLDPLVTISVDGKITDVNEATVQVTGVSREKLIGSDFSNYFTEPAKAQEGYQQSFLKGKVTDYPLTIRSATGKLTDVLYNASVYKDEKGNVLGVFAAARDYSRVKQTTSQLEISNKELEAFSYSISHDLRAPLRAVDGFSKILSEDYAPKLDTEGQRLLATIQQNAQQMGKLIDDLLRFSQMGRQELKTEEVDMTEAAKSVFQDLKASQPGREIEFDLRPLPPARVDPTLFHQVWTNLLSNALKFTRLRPKTVIEVGSRTEGERTIYYVKDNGAGFDTKFRDKLFGVFQRLHTPEEFEGTGVGLAIVQRIVTRHGGTAWADGKLAEGATFYFALSNGGGTDPQKVLNARKENLKWTARL